MVPIRAAPTPRAIPPCTMPRAAPTRAWRRCCAMRPPSSTRSTTRVSRRWAWPVPAATGAWPGSCSNAAPGPSPRAGNRPCWPRPRPRRTTRPGSSCCSNSRPGSALPAAKDAPPCTRLHWPGTRISSRRCWLPAPIRRHAMAPGARPGWKRRAPCAAAWSNSWPVPASTWPPAMPADAMRWRWPPAPNRPRWPWSGACWTWAWIRRWPTKKAGGRWTWPPGRAAGRSWLPWIRPIPCRPRLQTRPKRTRRRWTSGRRWPCCATACRPVAWKAWPRWRACATRWNWRACCTIRGCVASRRCWNGCWSTGPIRKSRSPARPP